MTDFGHPPCEVCGGSLGSRGHRCSTPMCRGTALRAERMLAAGVDINGESIHTFRGKPDDGHFVGCLRYSVETAHERTGLP